MAILVGPRRTLAAALVVAVVAACGSTVPTGRATPTPGSSAAPSQTAAGAPTPAPTPVVTPDPAQVAAVYRQIAAQVEAIRGLTTAKEVAPAVIDRAQLQHNLDAEFDKDNPAAEILKTQAIDEALGLLPAGTSLRSLELQLQDSQVIGYYDPSAKRLFIVSDAGVLGPLERATFAHEFTHELQDANFNLNGLGLNALQDDTDRALAILSLVEGDAVSVQTTWMTQDLSPAELAQLAAESADPTAAGIMARMPPILAQSSLFPYTGGAAFVATLVGGGGYAAVNAAFHRLPASTSEILHPPSYAAGFRPVTVVIPPDLARGIGTGWSQVGTDTFGEFQARVWLTLGGVPLATARTAAAGWAGDRLALLGGPNGATILILDSAWSGPADAAEFQAAATQAIAGLSLDGEAVTAGSRVVVGLRSGPSGSPSAATFDSVLRGLLGG